MKKLWIFVLLVLIIASSVFLLTRKDPAPLDTTVSKSLSLTLTPKLVDISAAFEIYTLGTKRVFTDPKYHNLSEEVYISLSDPSRVYVKKNGVTWTDFFATLPMKLTRDCLTTGTKQVFCTNETRKLKFFINNEDDSNALERVIKDGDELKIIYE